MSRPLKAISLGPDWPHGTPSGSEAQVLSPQKEQIRRCCWYSMTIGLISGKSHTWCRRGSGSTPVNLVAQRRQTSGFKGTTWLQSSEGITPADVAGGPADHP